MSYSEWCPRCGAKIVRVTRGIPSIGTCENGHMTDRRDVLRRDPKIDDRDARIKALEADLNTAIAAAYEAAAISIEPRDWFLGDGYPGTPAEQIRALTPADAIAARDADRAEAEQRGYANAMEAERKLHEAERDALRAEVKRLREALKPFADALSRYSQNSHELIALVDDFTGERLNVLHRDCWNQAAALGDSKP